jgi:hypothetical protein
LKRFGDLRVVALQTGDDGAGLIAAPLETSAIGTRFMPTSWSSMNDWSGRRHIRIGRERNCFAKSNWGAALIR